MDKDAQRLLEEQASKLRELERALELEASLEKIRTATMTMERSEELQHVVSVLYKELRQFDLAHWGCVIKIFHKDANEYENWFAELTESNLTHSYMIYGRDHPAILKEWEAWENQDRLTTTHLKGSSTHDFVEYLLTHSEYKNLPVQVKDMMRSSDEVCLTYAAMTCGLLTAIDIHAISEESQQSLIRFARVFEQAYTRFLDLQKAEEQAFEAKLETALERVRNRALAMHQSEELKNVVAVLYQEIGSLQMSANGFELILFKPKDEILEYWSHPASLETAQCFRIPRGAHPFFDQQWVAWENREARLVIQLEGKEKDHFDTTMFSQTDFKNLPEEIKNIIRKEESTTFSHVYMKYGFLEAIDHQVLSDDEFLILTRFAKVFEQTYTRFLDLQKAETQAQEARIEVALERVRSRTMAMHQSQELRDVVSVMYEQMETIGLAKWGCSIMIFHQETVQIENWIAEETDSKLTGNYFSKGKEHPVYQNLWSFWESQGEPMTLHHQDDIKKDFDDYWLNETDFKRLPDKVKASVYNRREVFLNYASMRYGLLNAVTYEPPGEYLLHVLNRFAKVFEQTYTRFIDLQKAEAQAREAQIEATIEKVRSSMMAMHKSEELRQVVATVFDQLQSLGFDPSACLIGIYNHDGSADHWIAGFTHDELPKSYYFPYCDHPYYIEELEAWQKGLPFYELVFEGDQKVEYAHFALEFSDYKHLPEEFKTHMLSPEKLYISNAHMKYGLMEVWSDTPLEQDDVVTLKRFAKVFEQSYTRFLDIQKAEAQAREAKIEYALERVRAASMAMYKSQDLHKVIRVVYQEMEALGMAIHSAQITSSLTDTTHLHCWIAAGGQVYPERVKIPIIDNVVMTRFLSAVKDEESFFTLILSKQQKDHYFRHYFENSSHRDVPEERQNFIYSVPGLGLSFALGEETGLCIMRYDGLAYQPEENDIIRRFHAVFEQSYRRFLDLQKAEAQAREAQIEAALERIRSRSMAMHRSEELGEVAILLYKEFINLDISNLFNCGFVIVDEVEKIQLGWMTQPEGTFVEALHLPYPGDAFMKKRMLAWKDKVPVFHQKLGGKALKRHQKYVADRSISQNQIATIMPFMPDPTIFYCGNFSEGYLHLIAGESMGPEGEAILARFAKVFEQTYTRFLDLQKAEAQAKEALIEAALERIRSRTMAMYKSSELSEAAVVVFQQLELLGVSTQTFGFIVFDEQEKQGKVWLTPDGKVIQEAFDFPLMSDPTFKNIYQAWSDNESYFIADLTGQKLRDHLEYVNQYMPVFDMMKRSHSTAAERLVIHAIFYSHGFLGINTSKPLLEDLPILLRFAKVFDQTYIRFLDLKKAEELAHESRIEAALENVRARTMAMQHSTELAETAKAVFAQFYTLGNVPDRISIGIFKEEDHLAEVYVTDQTGDRLDLAFTTRLDEPTTIAKIYQAWKNDETTHVVHLHGQELKNWVKYCRQVLKLYMDPARIKDDRFHHATFFSHGFLLLTTSQRSDEATLTLLGRFTNVFDQTYTRFLDLQNAELQARITKEQNQKLAESYENLKATQAQLIQAEKMASLGQLTAGIAHEIKNPLNFVNNFADVSNELIEEMKEELVQGNTRDALEIADDIVKNLEKILHHGRRADSIVKGMLEHSRTSDGKRELTDINALADEYLRLAFHGLRAKDKTFNATLHTDLDASIKQINIVPQDIGRVILNLITNAFHEVNACIHIKERGYNPTVSVFTKDEGESVVICVQDNGRGISSDIQDKIFQPFFTTKPTGEGTGLGLSLSYDIVKAHDGELTVESIPDEGATFIMTLPKAT